MVKHSKLKIALITLLIVLAVALSAAISLFGGSSTAYAADSTGRYVELSNSIFYRSIRGAQIVESDPIGSGEDEKRFAKFQIGKDQTIDYRRDLAYKWKTSSDSETTFSLKLSFPKVNFKTFYIKFESQQYTLTKDGKSTNYLVFTADGENVKIGVSATAEKDGDKITGFTDIKEIGTAAKNEEILIELGNYSEGNYTLKLNGEDKDGTFVNLSENFATYVASGDDAVTPLMFAAQFEENAEADVTAEMILYSLNGQSFEMKPDGGTYKVWDDVAPVICFSETPSYLEYGKTVGFKYKAIDVLGSSVRAIPYYYVLSGEQYENKNGDFLYEKYDYETAEGEEDKNPFFKITSSSSVRIIRDENSFIPRDLLDTNVYGLVKIYYELSDYSGTNGNKEVVFVDWYAKPDAVVDLAEIKNSENVPHVKFIKLIDDKEGATYAKSTDKTEDAYKESVKAFQTAYQDKIDKAIEKSEEGALYAGGDKKFYLPALGTEFFDDYFFATDYKYTIYYKAGSNSSNTAALEYNKLAIDLNEADVTYKFTIFITDGFGNPMRYPVSKDGGETVEWEEITKDDIWDEDKSDLLPYFEFDVAYKEASSKDVEDLSAAYVGTNYGGVSFKIDAQSGTYTAEYNLYVFDRNAYNTDYPDVNLEYDVFRTKVSELFNGPERKYFKTVKEASKLLENDPGYEDMKELNWNATNVTFTPRSIEDFYVVELVLTSNRSQIQKTNYAVVSASVETTALKGESDWAKNNMTSIILLCVAGVCLIAFIVLLIVKPKDKGDIDAVYTEVEEKDKKKSKKKSKNN